MKKHFLSKIKDKSGVAIMAVMLFFMVMLVMVGALTITSQGNLNVSGVSADNAAAYYAAEAGITKVTDDFRSLMNVDGLSMNQFKTQMLGIIAYYETNPIIELNQVNNNAVFAELSFDELIHNEFAQTLSFYIVSKGHVSGQIRTLSTLVDLEYGDNNQGESQAFAIQHSILVENSIVTSNQSQITATTGNPRIGTLSLGRTSSSIPYPIRLNGRFTNGVLDLLKDVDHTKVISSFSNIQRFEKSEITLPPIDFEPIRAIASTYESSNSINRNFNDTTSLMNHINNSTGPSSVYFIQDLDFSNFTGQTINVNRKVFIVTSSLELGNVRFSGDQTLTIYVKPSADNFIVPSSNNFSFGRINLPHLLVVYVDATSGISNQNSVTVPNGANIIGSFMFNNTSIYFNNGSRFDGYLLTAAEDRSSSQYAVYLNNQTDLTTNNAKAFVYARNGTVYLNQTARINGAIIARNVNLQNNASVNFDPAFLVTFPFNVTSPLVTPNTSGDIRVVSLNIHRTTEQ